ncbi:MAG: hypothetical protein ACFE95_15620 [Candidatus Hodarchaeota archaeon]
MSKLKNSLIIVFLVFFLSTTNINDNSLEMNTVQGVIEPTIESEIVIGIDQGHLNNLSSNEITNLTSILNATFDSQGVVFLTDEFSPDTLSNIDVLIILAPTEAYSEAEIEAVEDFLEDGKSLLIATGFRDQNTDATNDILNPYGLSFNLSSSIIPETARTLGNHYFNLARNFTDPTIPVTENITQIFFPNGVGISFNESRLESFKSPIILSYNPYNPILLKNSDELPSENNTLATTLELENSGRILAIGSANMFNNSFINPLPLNSEFMQNTEFILNAIKWLGKNTGIMNFYEPWVNLDDEPVLKNKIIRGNVTLLDSRNQTVIPKQIVIALEQDGSILSSRTMFEDSNNMSKFFGWISTENLKSGWIDVIFIANRQGYLPIELRATNFYLDPPFPNPILPNLAIWGLFLATLVLFLSTALFVRINLKEKSI